MPRVSSDFMSFPNVPAYQQTDNYTSAIVLLSLFLLVIVSMTLYKIYKTYCSKPKLDNESEKEEKKGIFKTLLKMIYAIMESDFYVKILTPLRILALSIIMPAITLLNFNDTLKPNLYGTVPTTYKMIVTQVWVSLALNTIVFLFRLKLTWNFIRGDVQQKKYKIKLLVYSLIISIYFSVPLFFKEYYGIIEDAFVKKSKIVIPVILTPDGGIYFDLGRVSLLTFNVTAVLLLMTSIYKYCCLNSKSCLIRCCCNYCYCCICYYYLFTFYAYLFLFYMFVVGVMFYGFNVFVVANQFNIDIFKQAALIGILIDFICTLGTLYSEINTFREILGALVDQDVAIKKEQDKFNQQMEMDAQKNNYKQVPAHNINQQMAIQYFNQQNQHPQNPYMPNQVPPIFVMTPENYLQLQQMNQQSNFYQVTVQNTLQRPEDIEQMKLLPPPNQLIIKVDNQYRYALNNDESEGTECNTSISIDEKDL
eukprot:403366398